MPEEIESYGESLKRDDIMWAILALPYNDSLLQLPLSQMPLSAVLVCAAENPPFPLYLPSLLTPSTPFSLLPSAPHFILHSLHPSSPPSSTPHTFTPLLTPSSLTPSTPHSTPPLHLPPLLTSFTPPPISLLPKSSPTSPPILSLLSRSLTHLSTPQSHHSPVSSLSLSCSS